MNAPRTPQVLIVDDEPEIRQLVKAALEREGCETCELDNGAAVLRQVKLSPPDLIVLDGMLPGMDGNDVVLKLKQDPLARGIPVIMLSARSEESDQLIGMKLGADDYLTKPFSPRLLAAKVSAMLRRQPAAAAAEVGEDAPLLHQGLMMSPAEHSASIDGQALKLTAVEFRLLYFLARKPGRVFTRERILDSVRGDDVILTGRTVDVHVLSLRRKLGERADLLETVRGVGYKIRE